MNESCRPPTWDMIPPSRYRFYAGAYRDLAVVMKTRAAEEVAQILRSECCPNGASSYAMETTLARIEGGARAAEAVLTAISRHYESVAAMAEVRDEALVGLVDAWDVAGCAANGERGSIEEEMEAVRRRWHSIDDELAVELRDRFIPALRYVAGLLPFPLAPGTLPDW